MKRTTMLKGHKEPNHYPSPWPALGIIIGMIALLAIVLPWAVLRPDVGGRQKQASNEFTAEMDAAEARAAPAPLPPPGI